MSDETDTYTREDTKELFRQLRDTGDPEIRATLTHLHLPLVKCLARRFKDRGEPMDDLVQVASVGLLKAIDRFDLDRGVEFSTYATPTIVGELKRYLRDQCWVVRVPRRLQELSLRMNKLVSQLTQELGRSPTVSELAQAAGISQGEALEALKAGQAYSTTSLDDSSGEDDDAPERLERIGEDDLQLENLEYFASLAPLIQQLPKREHWILYLRFFKGMTQYMIAEEIGVSQMHISRLLSRDLALLREGMDRPETELRVPAMRASVGAATRREEAAATSSISETQDRSRMITVADTTMILEELLDKAEHTDDVGFLREGLRILTLRVMEAEIAGRQR